MLGFICTRKCRTRHVPTGVCTDVCTHTVASTRVFTVCSRAVAPHCLLAFDPCFSCSCFWKEAKGLKSSITTAGLDGIGLVGVGEGEKYVKLTSSVPPRGMVESFFALCFLFCKQVLHCLVCHVWKQSKTNQNKLCSFTIAFSFRRTFIWQRGKWCVL